MLATKSGFYNFIKEPVFLTFIASVLLSLLAISGTVTIGKDGAFYVDIARSISDHGISVAFERFNWPWLSILIAGVHNLTKVNHELIAYFLVVFFMAGTCSLTVSMVKRNTPKAVYWAVLLVLSVPVFNEFRAEIIRETGFWFFIVLTVWLVIKKNNVSFLNGLFIQGAIVCATLFRSEALFIVPSIFIYLLIDRRCVNFRAKSLNLIKTFSVFFLILLAGLCFFIFTQMGSDVLEQGRIRRVLKLINPYRIYESFLFISEKFAQVVLTKWSQSDATTIVFFGFLIALIIRIISYAGLASLLLLDSTGRKGLIEGAKEYRLNIISIAVYFLILLIFFFQAKFINSRYSALLLILSIPILAVAVYNVSLKWPKLVKVIIALSLLLMFANVISTSTKKTHYLEAAYWVQENTKTTDKVYYEDSRVAYYAGRGYPSMPLFAKIVKNKVSIEDYDYFVIESGLDNKDFVSWAKENNLIIVAERSNGKRIIFILANKRMMP